MIWHTMTEFETRTLDVKEGDLEIRDDAFLLRRGGDLVLARAGTDLDVPPNVKAYRSSSWLWPAVREVIEKGTAVRRDWIDHHAAGLIRWDVYRGVILAGPHAGKEVRFSGYGPNLHKGALYEPNLDYFDYTDEYKPRRIE
jgi:hypothetical protein